VTYFIVYPILNLFRKKESLLFNNNEVSILVFLKENTSKFKKGSLLRLTKQSDQLFLVNSRFLFGKKEEKIQFSSSANVLQAHFKTIISDQHLIVILNRSYHKYIDDIASHLNIKVPNKVEI
jgi:hypothetical protein